MLLILPETHTRDDLMPTWEEWAARFAELCREIREASGDSVATMAEKWEVDERTYRKFERGSGQPGVIDFCYAMGKMDVPIMRPILEFLHPDVFADGTDDVEQMREQLMFYFGNVAQDRVVKQVYYNMVGQASDNVAPQLEMVNAIQEMPLFDRVMAVKFVMSLYEMAAYRGELLHNSPVEPDIAALKSASEEAEKACWSLKEAYHANATPGQQDRQTEER